ITANQTQDTWKASFERFSGNEKIEISSKPNHLTYLSSKWKTTEGKLDIVINGTALPKQNTINHTKIDLNKKATIKMVGENANGFYSLHYPIYEQKKININYNSNIELLALASFLINYEDFASIPDEQSFNINGKDIRIKDLYAINFKIANEFKSYLNSKNLQVIKTFFDKKFYLQYSNLLLSIDNFPNAKVNKENKFLSEFNSLQEAENFVNAFNNFSTEIKFNAFLEKYKPYYDKMILEVSQNIPKQNFITEMEHLYNKQVKNYNLYPSLTLGFGQAFGVGRENMIGNIFACFNKPEKIDNPKDLELGFNNETSLRTICIHEFGHSFINPAIDTINPTILEEKKALFEPIKNKMSEQGYTEWKICLYEHFVRANEVMVTRLLNENQKADEILNDNYKNRSFIYLPQIIEKLEFWYYNEYFDKTYEEKIREIIQELK
ncbi:DUF4932 domain-containing protein, partial [Flavobacterium sp.]|uniref:DUF4932 domain-containing protein n=1 Tax=Flavobacterium sp. TaxID=239 RepID=UPI0026205621